MKAQMPVTNSMKAATHSAIRKIAWHTAQGKGQRAKDAQKHCQQLGIDWTLPLPK